MRGGGDGARGSGQRKGARSEDGVWESDFRVSGSEASGAGIWGSVLGLEIGPRLHGLGLTGWTRAGPGPVWDLRAAGCAGVLSGAFGMVICGGKRGALPWVDPDGAPLFPPLDRLFSGVPIAFPGPALIPVCIRPSPLCGPAAPSSFFF